MATAVIPRDLPGAIATLGTIDRLLTATQWERAAIVYAWSESRQGGRKGPKFSGDPEKLSFAALAQRGIHGLTNKDTVAFYARRWQQAIDMGVAEAARPGAEVTLPDLPWEKQEAAAPARTEAQARREQIEQVREFLAEPANASAVLHDQATAKALVTAAPGEIARAQDERHASVNPYENASAAAAAAEQSARQVLGRLRDRLQGEQQPRRTGRSEGEQITGAGALQPRAEVLRIARLAGDLRVAISKLTDMDQVTPAEKQVLEPALAATKQSLAVLAAKLGG